LNLKRIGGSLSEPHLSLSRRSEASQSLDQLDRGGFESGSRIASDLTWQSTSANEKRHPEGWRFSGVLEEGLYCSRFQLIISPSVVVELDTGAL
jgi:hypothetical protein